MTDEMMLIKDVMAELKMSYTAVRKHIGLGNLEATKPARKILVYRQSVEKFKERGRIVPRSA